MIDSKLVCSRFLPLEIHTQAQQTGFHHPLLSWCLLDTVFASRNRRFYHVGEYDIRSKLRLLRVLKDYVRNSDWDCGWNPVWDHMLSLQSGLVS